MASRPIQILLVAAHPADNSDMAGGDPDNRRSLPPLGIGRTETQSRRRN